MENRQEILVSDRGQRLQPRSKSTCENDTFQGKDLQSLESGYGPTSGPLLND